MKNEKCNGCTEKKKEKKGKMGNLESTPKTHFFAGSTYCCSAAPKFQNDAAAAGRISNEMVVQNFSSS
jgi:hypothetical protein